MQRHFILSAILVGAAGLVMAHATPASALTMKECSAKYKAAQTAGTLGAKTWNDFRKAECGPGATGAVSAPSSRQPTTPPATPMAKGNLTLPSAVSPKYSSESAGKARMHTCLDQYKANQAAGGSGNAGLKWIQKGGGFYSQCNAHLKG